MWSDDDYGNLEGFDTAQVCINGHMINVCFQRSPEFNQKHCDRCGAPTITTCQKCNSPIRGMRMNTTIMGGGAGRGTVPPNFCYECGEPYPWLSAKLEAARELADELELSNEDKTLLKQSLDDIVTDSPKTTVASTRFKRLLTKAGQGAAECMKQVLYSVATEAAKKQIWG